MRSHGYAVESICRVLREQGVVIAARTYRHAKATGPSPRTVSDAQLLDILHGLKGTPASLYGRRKMVAHLRRLGHEVAHCTVGRLMGVAGIAGVSRRKSPSRNRNKQSEDRASDLLHRDFTAAAPNLVWVADFTYVMTNAGWVYVALIVDVYSQRIVAWHAQTSKGVELVRIRSASVIAAASDWSALPARGLLEKRAIQALRVLRLMPSSVATDFSDGPSVDSYKAASRLNCSE